MRVAVITNFIPSYRAAFYRRLQGVPGLSFTIYCNADDGGTNLKLCHHEFASNLREVPMLGSERHLVWQRLPIVRLWRNYDTFVFYGNPRVVSTVVWATLFRCLGRRVVIWGQGHTAGANALTERVRLLWWRIFRSVLVYTDAEARRLCRLGFSPRRLTGINNGLAQDTIDAEKSKWTVTQLETWRRENQLTHKTLLISVARLVPKNRLHLIVGLLPRLTQDFPSLVWCIIGSGPEEERIRRRGEELCVGHHIKWIGELYEEHLLAPWFLSAACLVHPGAIGLTLCHAFGYALPVVTHDNAEMQMPEFAALIPDVNSLTFREDDMKGFGEAVTKLIGDPELKARLGRNALSQVRTRFNCSVMVDRFMASLEKA